MATKSASPDKSKASFLTCLKKMCRSQMKYCKIHQKTIMHQVPNTHETYLPVTLSSSCGLKIKVTNLFDAESFKCQRYGDLECLHADQPRVFIIYGMNGIGKTALLHYLNYQWLMQGINNVKNIVQFSLVLYIDSYSVQSPSPLELLENRLVLDAFPEGMDIGEINERLKKEKILWLFDDCTSSRHAAKFLLCNLLTNYPFSEAVVTTSPWRDNGIGMVMDWAHIKYLSLDLTPPRCDDLEQMVPKMVRAKTEDLLVIWQASARFLRHYSVPHLAHDAYALAVLVDKWMTENYPEEGKVKVIDKRTERISFTLVEPVGDNHFFLAEEDIRKDYYITEELPEEPFYVKEDV